MEIFRHTFLADPADFPPGIADACALGKVMKCPKTGFEIWFEDAPIDREESNDLLNIDVRLAPEDIVALRFDGDSGEFEPDDDDDGMEEGESLWLIVTVHGDYHVPRYMYESLATLLIEAGFADKIKPKRICGDDAEYEWTGDRWKKFEYAERQ